jgi:hypothetical protein
VELSQTTAFDREVGRVSANLTLADRQAHAAFELADVFTTGDATLALPSPGAFSIDTQTRDADLAVLASRLGVAIDARGLARFRLRARRGVRDDMAHPHATIDLLRLRAPSATCPPFTDRAARATTAARSTSPASRWTLVRAARRAAARRAGGWALTFQNLSSLGQAGNLQRLAGFSSVDSFLSLQVDGPGVCRHSGTGTLIGRPSG